MILVIACRAEEQSEESGGAFGGSLFIQATGISPLLKSITLDKDPFGELEDSFDTSRQSSSTSHLALLTPADFWIGFIRDNIVFPMLFLFVPLGLGILIEARLRAAGGSDGPAASSRKEQLQSCDESPPVANFVPLMEAARSGDAARWRELLPKQPNCTVDRFGTTALHVAAGAPCTEMAAALVEEKRVDVEAKDMWEETALHFAARSGSDDVCNLLLAHRADINALSSDDVTPLLAAAKANQKSICKLLLEKGASHDSTPGSMLASLMA
jgi:hypothetical protein